MKKLILFLLVGFLAAGSNAQTVLLETDTLPESTSSFGPNRKHFVHFFLGYGLLFGQNNAGAKIRVPASDDFTFGLRYKLKLSETVALGLETNYNMNTFSFRQEAGKQYADTVLNDKEELELFYLEPALFVRFNFGERGNVVGRFIDIGAGLPIKVGSAHYTSNELPTGEIREITTSKLQYIEPFAYHAFGRIGFNNLVFYYRYRFSDVFKANAGFPALPAMSFGLQLGLH